MHPTLSEINRLLVHIAPHSKAWHLVQLPLLRAKSLIEDIYYTHVLAPKLASAFALHKSIYERCVMVVLYSLDQLPWPPLCYDIKLDPL
jgi:hypothetical protein